MDTGTYEDSRARAAFAQTSVATVRPIYHAVATGAEWSRMKPTVFVSHVHESSELASALSTEISRLLLDGVDFFVSSDRSSIIGGDRWLDKIDAALANAEIVLVLCDRNSLLRPWINFEAGGAWVAKKRVVPLCHGDLTPDQLPHPLLVSRRSI